MLRTEYLNKYLLTRSCSADLVVLPQRGECAKKHVGCTTHPVLPPPPPQYTVLQVGHLCSKQLQALLHCMLAGKGCLVRCTQSKWSIFGGAQEA